MSLIIAGIETEEVG